MQIVRPCRHSDLASIEKLVNSYDARVTTLPIQRDKLSEKIDLSCRSFGGDPDLSGRERYLFVLEDTESGEILGTSGIDVAAGNGYPFYNYRLDELIHSSHFLGVSHRIPVLYLSHELTDKALLCSLTLAKSIRNTPSFELLSRARLLFIAQFREKFGEDLIVEIQGVQDENRQSPFWDSLGRHFFNMDFPTADYYSAVKSKTFIAELMPPHPIYVPLLSAAASSVIGQPHDAARETCQLLHREGFRIGKHIDIFDGGPTLEAHIADLVTVKTRSLKQIRRSDAGRGVHYLMCNGSLEDFRCLIGRLNDGIGDIIRVHHDLADALSLDDDETMAFTAL